MSLFVLPTLRVSKGGGGGGPCSLVPFQNCPMFPCSNTLSECFRTVSFRILLSRSQKLANVPLFPLIFCQCSLVPQNPSTLVTILPDRPPGGGGPTNISLCFNFSENAQEMMDALRDKSNDEVKTLLGRHVVQQHDKCNRIKESFGKYLHKGLDNVPSENQRAISFLNVINCS